MFDFCHDIALPGAPYEVLERIWTAKCIDFARPGFIYYIRSGTNGLPWDALAERKLKEVELPLTLTRQQVGYKAEKIVFPAIKRQSGYGLNIVDLNYFFYLCEYCHYRVWSVLSELLYQTHKSLPFTTFSVDICFGNNLVLFLLPLLSFYPLVPRPTSQAKISWECIRTLVTGPVPLTGVSLRGHGQTTVKIDPKEVLMGTTFALGGQKLGECV